MWSAFHERLDQLIGLGLDLGAGRGGSSLGGVGEDFGEQAADKSANKPKESRGVKTCAKYTHFARTKYMDAEYRFVGYYVSVQRSPLGRSLCSAALTAKA